MNTSNIMNDILYKFIDSTVNEALIKQQEFVWDNVQNEEKLDKASNEKEWSKILNFTYPSDESKESKESSNGEKKQLRQDAIENGIKPDKSEIDLFMQLTKMGNSGFDLISSYTFDIYLTLLLVESHSMNAIFHNEVKRILQELSNGSCKFAPAPVKTRERCIIKTQTDYFEQRYFF